MYKNIFYIKLYTEKYTMPFSNSYNKGVASKVITNAKRDIAIKQQMYDNPAAFVEPRSAQEYMSVQQPEIQGGSGNLAATSYDMGEETKKVGGSRVNKARAKRVASALEGGAKPMVITDTVAVKPKRVRKAKTTAGDGARGTTAPVGTVGGDARGMAAKGGDFNDVMDAVKKTASTVGDVVKTAATVAPYVLPLVGLGKEGKPKRTMAHLSEWNALVKKVRTETGKSLKDALKHIKENNLYKKKGATEHVKQPTVKRARKKRKKGGAVAVF